MKFVHAAAVALLVVLAGCGGFLGGGGTATPSVAPTGAPTSTPTATPVTTATATPTATTTPTPLPESYTTRTVTNESLGVTFDLAGNESALDSVLTAEITGIRITRGAVKNCARATPFVAISTNAPVADVTATMSYDTSMLPPNASESELAVFVYNKTVDFYLQMDTVVDVANDTATGTGVADGQTFSRETENGTRRISPKLDGTRLDNAFVVMHAPTYWEAVESGQVPERCRNLTPTPGETSTASGTATASGTTASATNATAAEATGTDN
jgi:hypothetical protein